MNSESYSDFGFKILLSSLQHCQGKENSSFRLSLSNISFEPTIHTIQYRMRILADLMFNTVGDIA